LILRITGVSLEAVLRNIGERQCKGWRQENAYYGLRTSKRPVGKKNQRGKRKSLLETHKDSGFSSK
jgi:hypothetical protein